MLRACLKKHSRKLHNIIFLFPQRQHRINTSLRLHSHILIQLDLFSALTADAIINIHQCSQFHIVTIKDICYNLDMGVTITVGG